MIVSADEDNSITEPQGWAAVPLIEAVTLQRGFDLPVQDRTAGTVPIYAANGPVGTHNIARVKGPGVVTGRSGTIGKVHFVETDFWPLNTSLYVRDFHGNDPQFIALLLKKLGLERYLAGTGVPTLNRNVVHEVVVAIPPLREQQRIVAKVESLSHCVEVARDHLSQVPLILKRFRQAVLAAACSGKLTEDWRHSRTLESGLDLLHRLRAASKGAWESARASRAGRRSASYRPPEAAITEDTPEIPDQWTWASPEELIDYERPHSLAIGPFGSDLKVSDYKAQGIPLVFVRNIRSQSFADTKYVSKEKADELRAHWTQPGDILITKMGDPPGDACLYPDGSPTAVITADCIKMRVSSLLTEPMFFVHAINSGTVRDQIFKITMGVAQPKVSLERFRRIAIPLPPIEEQRESARRVEALLALGDAVEQRVRSATLRANKLTESILAKAFRGELVPTEAELARREGRDYELASVLLERIGKERESSTLSKPDRKWTRRNAKLAATKG
jgi:type I restriction enzyme, S subunit